MRVHWHPSARDEADLAAAFYQRQREGLGRRFLDSLDDAVARASARPGIYPTLAPGIRKCRLKTFPYALVFRGEREIQILAVMHARRTPDYWRNRA
ncbi:type II toxin-antitoxin system RelE/ParE family toxin [Thiohalocapsa sp. ML1]|uniref:type II toxin-antitoxin system RelE/ParE family toxin n=1 Tax=Thiohalocapsa sp. ML1 TaxID=1431688 RepID=UPI00073237FA|nr:type II toxin-antitoxin system RelE/ParE family toxin [Thiohalocapsa sp. ML1]